MLVGCAGFAVRLQARLVQRRALEHLEHRALVQHQGEGAVVALAGGTAHGLDLLRLVQGEVCHDHMKALLLDLGIHHHHVEPTRVVGGEERDVLLAHGEPEHAFHVALFHLRRHNLLDLDVTVGWEVGNVVAGLLELAQRRLGLEVDQHGPLLRVGSGVEDLSDAVVLRDQVVLEDHAPLRPGRRPVEDVFAVLVVVDVHHLVKGLDPEVLADLALDRPGRRQRSAHAEDEAVRAGKLGVGKRTARHGQREGVPHRLVGDGQRFASLSFVALMELQPYGIVTK
mmetsp:Transcript_5392/g.12191  ORF Transcript_5392/g.12191 Transcript_5392/m.12191 type:complete len:283 (+) Transcript_5392:1386-2234(+)